MVALKAVILDLNGTLVNDRRATYKSIVSIFKHYEITPPTSEQFRYEFHFPYWSIFINHGLSYNQAKDECKQLYARFYEEELGKVRLFPNAKRCLSDLEDLGYKLGLVSQSSRLIVENLLEKFGISHFFEVIVSLDDCVEQKPNPLPLLLCSEKIGVKPRECIYFGDMVEDQQAAQNARMFKGVVASKGSYHPVYALQSTNPHVIVSDLDEIPEKIVKFDNSLLVRTC